MQISNSYTPSFSSHSAYFKQNNTTCNQTQSQSPEIKTNCSLENYQAQCNISFGKKQEKEKYPFLALSNSNGNISKISAKVTLNSGERCDLLIDKETIDLLFKTKDGKFDKKAVQQFIPLYKKTLEGLIKDENEYADFIKSIAKGDYTPEKKSNITYIDQNQEMLAALSSALSDSEDFTRTIFDNISNDKLRQNLAQSVMNATGSQKNNLKQLEQNALHDAKIIFYMCKTQNGQDFSEMERKNALLKRLEYAEWNFSNEDNIALDVIKASKQADGTTDLDYAETLCSLIEDSGSYREGRLVSYRDDIIKDFVNQDNKNAKLIMEYMKKLSKITYPTESNNMFRNIFSLCFNKNTGEFDIDAANLLIKTTIFADKYIDKLLSDENSDYYDSYDVENPPEEKWITGYFEKIKDEKTGKIKEGVISFEEYMKNAI